MQVCSSCCARDIRACSVDTDVASLTKGGYSDPVDKEGDGVPIGEIGTTRVYCRDRGRNDDSCDATFAANIGVGSAACPDSFEASKTPQWRIPLGLAKKKKTREM